jgi:DNA polymerase/3'-5' exonuclease PolX
MNDKLISEFDRLIAFIREEADKYQQHKDFKKVQVNQFRIKQLSVVLSILKKYPNQITLENINELKDISGIGKGSLERIKEILTSGSLKELGSFVDSKKEKRDAIENLEEIVGIGRSKALELIDKGITSVEILKENQEVKMESSSSISL